MKADPVTSELCDAARLTQAGRPWEGKGTKGLTVSMYQVCTGYPIGGRHHWLGAKLSLTMHVDWLVELTETTPSFRQPRPSRNLSVAATIQSLERKAQSKHQGLLSKSSSCSLPKQSLSLTDDF